MSKKKYYKFDAFKLQENVLRFFYYFAMVVLCDGQITRIGEKEL